MKRFILFIQWFSFLILFLLISNASVNAGALKDVKLDYLVMGTGLEYMSYTEYEPETGSYTDTSMVNMVTKFEGCLSMEPFFLDIKGVVPLYLAEANEDWRRHRRVYQTDNLEYSWVRLDGNIGYRMNTWLNPYFGLRWANSRQERTNFFLSKPVNMESIETNRALFLSTGFKGTMIRSYRWEFGYSFECFMPIFSRTKNTALPGWKSSANDGYSIGARAVARYKHSPSVSMYYELSGERTYWYGSGWIDYPGGSAKWPENETVSLNSILGIAWIF
jgi:hypothetical protein